MEFFGWAVLIMFALIGFAIVVYVFCEFAIIQIRLFHLKVGGEIELMREDNKKSKELKRTRIETRREAKHKMATQKLNARLNRLQKKNDDTVEMINNSSDKTDTETKE